MVFWRLSLQPASLFRYSSNPVIESYKQHPLNVSSEAQKEVGVTTRTVLDAQDIERALIRISHEIVESNQGTQNLLILGIPTRGVYLANRIAEAIARNYPNFDVANSLGQLDVTQFRDDLATTSQRKSAPTVIPVPSLADKTVVLIDDVLFSGRTVRAALDALLSYGRPKAVRLAVLIDRGHRELPIRADFVGKNLPTSFSERIYVKLTESDAEQFVVIEQ
jgi:pyrimidine operon attenuation protein/uracil phosphoribosyltransferase